MASLNSARGSSPVARGPDGGPGRTTRRKKKHEDGSCHRAEEIARESDCGKEEGDRRARSSCSCGDKHLVARGTRSVLVCKGELVCVCILEPQILISRNDEQRGDEKHSELPIIHPNSLETVIKENISKREYI